MTSLHSPPYESWEIGSAHVPKYVIRAGQNSYNFGPTDDNEYILTGNWRCCGCCCWNVLL